MTRGLAAIQADADLLDRLLGDPWDPGNRAGFTALLAADERQEPLAEIEDRLGDYRLNAEFVPAVLGGRFQRLDRLVEIMRTVWRRDPCLGFAYGGSTLTAAASVWGAGDERQQRTLADLLLSGGKVAAIYNDPTGANCADARISVSASRPSWRLDGAKGIIANIYCADALVILAEATIGPGGHRHSQFFVPKCMISEAGLRYLPRFPTSGMRGLELGGVEFTGCLIPPQALLGKPGHGTEMALSVFLLSGCVSPAMCVGILDTALRTALNCGLHRKLYGGAVTDLASVRAQVGRAMTDLLTADVFSAVTIRSLHMRPGETRILAPAVNYLTFRVLADGMAELRTVLGAQSYLREGPSGIFQKLARDLPLARFAYVPRAGCQAILAPQLPGLARHRWFGDRSPQAALFRIGAELPSLNLTGLITEEPCSDSLCATLVEFSEKEGDDGLVIRFARRFRDELGLLRRECAELGVPDLTDDASPAARRLADRYTIVLAAAACLGVWWHGRDGLADSDVWLPAVLDRLSRRLGGSPVLPERTQADLGEAMFRLALKRHGERRLFDMLGRMVPG